MTPLDLDSAALRALCALCGDEMGARLAWSRWGVEVTLTRDGEIVGTARASTLVDAVIAHATIHGREDVAAPLRTARARLSTAPTQRPACSTDSDELN